MNRLQRMGRSVARLFECCWPRRRREMAVSDDIAYVRLTTYDLVWRWMEHSDFSIYPEVEEEECEYQITEDITPEPELFASEPEEELIVQHHIYEHEPDGDCCSECELVPVEKYENTREWRDKKISEQVTLVQNNREVKDYVGNLLDKFMYEEDLVWLANIYMDTTRSKKDSSDCLDCWSSLARWNDLVGSRGCERHLRRLSTIGQIVSIDPETETSRARLEEDFSWEIMNQRVTDLKKEVSRFLKMVERLHDLVGIDKGKRSRMELVRSFSNIVVGCKLDVSDS